MIDFVDKVHQMRRHVKQLTNFFMYVSEKCKVEFHEV